MFEPPAIVSGLKDFAVVGQSVQQRGRHLGVAENRRPFCKSEIGGDHHGRALVEAADQME